MASRSLPNSLMTLLQSNNYLNRNLPIRFLCISRNSRKPQEDGKTTNTGPLSGIRILDLTRVLAGPFATMVLSDMGASVIKVEKPGSGDDTRSWGPPFVGDQSSYFFSVNRNKKSLAVDLKKEEGVKIVQKLAEKCDVLIENFIPGTLERIGVGYSAISAINPRLVYCSLTGYGSTGPYSERPGYDVMAASVGGLMGVTGPPGGAPVKVGVAMTDLATGLYAHGAIIAALMERASTNKGQKIECDLLSTQVTCMVNLASSYLNAGIVPKASGTAHASIVPYQAFQTSDSYISIAGNNDMQFRSLCDRINLPQLKTDKRFSANSDRVRNRSVLIPLLSDRFVEHTTQHWLEVFEGSVFPYAPINSLDQTFSDPQIVHKDMVQNITHPTAGEIKLVKPAVTFEKSVNCIRSAPPVLGQHTESLLKELLNYSHQDIVKLNSSRVIQCSSLEARDE